MFHNSFIVPCQSVASHAKTSSRINTIASIIAFVLLLPPIYMNFKTITIANIPATIFNVRKLPEMN